MATMYQQFKNLVTEFLFNELKTARILFFMLFAGFALFAFFGNNNPLLGPVSHRAMNLIYSFTALLFVILLFTKNYSRYYQQVGYAYIYILNLGSIYVLYGTSFNEQYAYQFIVTYVISGWFFRHEWQYYLHTLVINIVLVLTSLLSEHTTQSTFDFYATYTISAFAQLVLIRYRFGVEDKLKENEKKYRLLAENSRDIICIHDTDSKVIYVSPAIERILGYKDEEVIGKKLYDFVHPEDKILLRSLNLSEPEHPSVYDPVQYRVIDKNGDYHWLETVFKSVRDEVTGEERVLTQSRDIRRSKGYQTQLEDRTKELERSYADLETFTFVSSHDMKEPLRMISNYMQLLKKRYGDKLDAEANEYIDFANKGAVTLQQLIHDLLAYSRVTRTQIKCEKVSLAAVAGEAIKNTELILREKNAAVKYDADCQVNSDRGLLVLVLQNLIENGIKYNNSTQPVVELGCMKEGDRVIIYVRDNGEGIAENHQKRIFEPFHRLHTKAEIPGTGLGLSICKRIVDRLDGKIWLQSELGKGTTFYFSLPG
ncbi:MAG: PAS domain S-box protein [Chitinophagales bacterium]|nr:PAS domain S-box protein [Chitinophagales bacterium]